MVSMYESDGADGWGAYWEVMSYISVEVNSVDYEGSMYVSVSMSDYYVGEGSDMGAAVPSDSYAYADGAVGMEGWDPSGWSYASGAKSSNSANYRPFLASLYTSYRLGVTYVTVYYACRFASATFWARFREVR